MDYISMVKALILNTDLEQFATDNEKLSYAVEYAKTEITNRYGAESFEKVPAKYGTYVVEGAKWYLSMIGAEGQAAMSENGISRTYKGTPDWLSHITPKVGVVKKNVAKTKTKDSVM